MAEAEGGQRPQESMGHYALPKHWLCLLLPCRAHCPKSETCGSAQSWCQATQALRPAPFLGGSSACLLHHAVQALPVSPCPQPHSAHMGRTDPSSLRELLSPKPPQKPRCCPSFLPAHRKEMANALLLIVSMGDDFQGEISSSVESLSFKAMSKMSPPH